MEVAIRWSPHSTLDHPQFLIGSVNLSHWVPQTPSNSSSDLLLVDVGGNRLQLCEIESTDTKPIKYKQLCRRDKLPNYTAFDWSKTQPYIVGIGAASGEANIVQIDPNKSSTEESIWSFPIKHQRKCNSIAFSTKNFLATGLDRVRNDFCMNVYDLNAVTSSGSSLQEPYKKLAVSEAISSIKFFNQQPDTLVAGVFRQCVRLYDLRDSTTSGYAQFPTRQVHNLAIDPLDENYFISAGPPGEPTVSVWDRRFAGRTTATTPQEGPPPGAVLEIKPAVDNSQSASIWSLRFSGTKRGLFGALSSTGEIKIVEIAQHSVKGLPTVSPHNPHGGTPWAFKHYVRQTKNLTYPWYDEERGMDEANRVVACDFMSANCVEKGASLLALHPSREIERLNIPDRSPQIFLTAMDELYVFNDVKKSFKPQYKYFTAAEELLGFRLKVDGLSLDRQSSAEKALNDSTSRLSKLSLEHHKASMGSASGESSESMHEEALSLSFPDYTPELPEALAFLGTQKRRCQEGYRLDPARNKDIVADDPWLVDMWDTVKRFDDMARNGGMRSGGLDLSYLGVHAIWNNSFGKHRNRTFNSGAFEADQFIDAVVSIAQSKGYPAFQGFKTRKPAHRQLCLAVCGWTFSKERLRSYCKRLIENGKHYRAIVIAVMRGFKDLAQELLKLSIQQKGLQNVGLGAVIACETVNQEQRDLCEWMMEATEDPYLRALLAYFVTGDWKVVADMDSLALTDRVGVALKYLDDGRLDEFIKMKTAQSVVFGNIEGVVLTGLTDRTMDLFWHYIAKFNDLQTAALAMSFACPLYLTDPRYQMWKETYLVQMQSWRCFNERFLFITDHAKRCVSQDRKRFTDNSANGTSGPDAKLRCDHCHNPFGMRRLKSSNADGAQVTVTAPSNLPFSRSSSARDGIICPHCGRVMPECGVCGVLLGAPDSKRLGTMTAGEVAKDDVLAKQTLYCFTCEHAFHGQHAREWFAKHKTCAVRDCECECAKLSGLRV